MKEFKQVLKINKELRLLKEKIDKEYNRFVDVDKKIILANDYHTDLDKSTDLKLNKLRVGYELDLLRAKKEFLETQRRLILEYVVRHHETTFEDLNEEKN